MARGKAVEGEGPFRIEDRPGGHGLALQGIVGASRAHALLETARALATAEGDVTLDLSALRHADCAAVQVLLALGATLRSQGRTFVLVEVPEGVATTLRNAGLENLQ